MAAYVSKHKASSSVSIEAESVGGIHGVGWSSTLNGHFLLRADTKDNQCGTAEEDYGWEFEYLLQGG